MERKVYTPEIRQCIEEMINNGYQTKEIAEGLGLKYKSLKSYMCKNNLYCIPLEGKNSRLLQEWDALHRWYRSYRRRHPKKTV